jgi:hypothetical protein
MRQSISFIAVSAALVFAMRVQAQTKAVDLYVEDPRPVAGAVASLTSRFPVVVTYEDPPYRFPGDLTDVTSMVRRDQYEISNVPKIIVPMTRALAVRYEGLAENDEPQNWQAALQAVVAAHDVNAAGGRFRVQQDGDVFHVVPSEVQDQRGRWVAQTPVLDALISIPRTELGGYQMLERICKELSETTGARVIVGVVPPGAFMFQKGILEAKDEQARDVLLRTIREMHPGLTWQFLYGVSGDRFALNVLPVFAPPPPTDRVGPMRPRQGVPSDESPFITPEGRAAAERARAEAATDRL